MSHYLVVLSILEFFHHITENFEKTCFAEEKSKKHELSKDRRAMMRKIQKNTEAINH